MGKGKRTDAYLEVRKRSGIYFLNETSACVKNHTQAEQSHRCALFRPRTLSYETIVRADTISWWTLINVAYTRYRNPLLGLPGVYNLIETISS